MEKALKQNGWTSCSSNVVSFSFAGEAAKITASPAGDEGPAAGWISTIDGCHSVGYIYVCVSLSPKFTNTLFFICAVYVW